MAVLNGAELLEVPMLQVASGTVIRDEGMVLLGKVHVGVAEILERGNVIGDRKNGLKDGISNEWFATFDLYSPAVRRGQTPSLVIDRPILQEILMKNIKDAGAVVRNGCEVVGCERTPTGSKEPAGVGGSSQRREASLSHVAGTAIPRWTHCSSPGPSGAMLVTSMVSTLGFDGLRPEMGVKSPTLGGWRPS